MSELTTNQPITDEKWTYPKPEFYSYPDGTGTMDIGDGGWTRSPLREYPHAKMPKYVRSEPHRRKDCRSPHEGPNCYCYDCCGPSEHEPSVTWHVIFKNGKSVRGIVRCEKCKAMRGRWAAPVGVPLEKFEEYRHSLHPYLHNVARATAEVLR